MEIGKNIARLRRERGLTQEQLGQMLNISGQAVSKWERGGTPDTEMLPSIADRLGVTIDTLFGRESEPAENMAAALMHWLGGFPAERRMMEFFRLLCAAFQRPYYTDNERLGEILDAMFHLPLPSCYSTEIRNGSEERLWLRSAAYLDEGLQLGVLGEDCPMFLLLPEPDGGFEANLAEDEAYRSLFSALSLPGALAVLRCFARRKDSYYSVKAIAKYAGVEPAEAENALDALASCHILNQTTVEGGEGPVEVFRLHDTGALIPFLLFARWMGEKDDAFLCNWMPRKRPILEKRGVAGDE